MPKTRRTVKDSKKTASVSRSAAFDAATKVKARRLHDEADAVPHARKSASYQSAPVLVKG